VDGMRFLDETSADGMTMRLFTLGDVPGAVWAPADATGPRPLVLLGHGGGGHKTDASVTGRARRLVLGRGWAVAAIDAHGFAGRPVPAEYEPLNTEIEELRAAGKPIGEAVARRAAVAAKYVVPEWRAAIDALAGLDWIGADGPVGYWGVSLGTALGLPLVAAEPRITAAVLGLMGGWNLAQIAAQVTIPVQFHLQWDDELVPRADGLALFDALGSAGKTLHANPGRHGDTPRFEADNCERFFVRHLSRPQA
jgi:dienelactone hydrolase